MTRVCLRFKTCFFLVDSFVLEPSSEPSSQSESESAVVAATRSTSYAADEDGASVMPLLSAEAVKVDGDDGDFVTWEDFGAAVPDTEPDTAEDSSSDEEADEVEANFDTAGPGNV